ncbi:MAG: hypothetical protein JWP09_859 [Candidatus Taylorbacteria bacterium]|nr:hypothetical protein [Candidatus Taylorbacteria bacterium]
MDEAEKNRLIEQAVIIPDVKKKKVGILGYHFTLFLLYTFPALVLFIVVDRINGVYGWNHSFNFAVRNYFSIVPLVYLGHLLLIFGLMIASFLKRENRKGVDYLFTFLLLAIFYIPVMFIGLLSACSSGC